MQEAEIPVTYQPSDRTVYVLKGTKVLEAAADADLVLEVPCGGEGKCGKCRVVIAGEAGGPMAAECRVFSADELRAGCRLACQSSVDRPMAVHVPETSLVRSHHKILVHSQAPSEMEGDPVLHKRYVEMPAPARGDDDSDLVRLEKVLGRFEADLDLLRALPRRLRQSGFRGTAVLAEGRLLDFEPENTEWDACVAAVDVGTTTLVATLLDAISGRELSVSSRLNPQTRFGDDVLARILHARDRADGLDHLQQIVVGAVNEMIGELCRGANVPRGRVYEVIFSGNTTMQQLLCGIDPSSLGEVPFPATLDRGLTLPAAELGVEIHTRGRVRLLPVIGCFVGGDTVAGILATGLAEAAAPALLIDIGTNGEIALSAGGKLRAASTAAGPAFEGARISQGMRASSGAIEKVVIDGCLRFHVINHVRPVGLCGSALIDVAAELLRHGVLTPQGRLRRPDELPADVLPDLVERMVVQDGQIAFRLAREDETGHGKPILLTQRDLRELQLATGAIRAGTAILLRRAGLQTKDLDRVFVAGGFGNFIRRSNAQRIGLLPCDIQRSRIRFQGNTSLAGARMVALSQSARQRADDIARATEHVDLSCDPEFHTAFAEAMIFPEGAENRPMSDFRD